jgi:hypothetical protein
MISGKKRRRKNKGMLPYRYAFPQRARKTIISCQVSSAQLTTVWPCGTSVYDCIQYPECKSFMLLLLIVSRLGFRIFLCVVVQVPRIMSLRTLDYFTTFQSSRALTFFRETPWIVVNRFRACWWSVCVTLRPLISSRLAVVAGGVGSEISSRLSTSMNSTSPAPSSTVTHKRLLLVHFEPIFSCSWLTALLTVSFRCTAHWAPLLVVIPWLAMYQYKLWPPIAYRSDIYMVSETLKMQQMSLKALPNGSAHRHELHQPCSNLEDSRWISLLLLPLPQETAYLLIHGVRLTRHCSACLTSTHTGSHHSW